MGIRHSKRLLAHLSNLDAHNTLMLFSRVQLCRSVQCVVLVPRTEPRREAWWLDFPTSPKRWGTLGWRRWAPPNLSDDFPINFPINWPSCSISFSVKTCQNMSISGLIDVKPSNFSPQMLVTSSWFILIPGPHLEVCLATGERAAKDGAGGQRPKWCKLDSFKPWFYIF